MKKYIFALCMLGSIATAVGYTSLSQSQINSYTQSGYTISNEYSSLANCSNEKALASEKYTSFTRSDCFNNSTDSKYYYFICTNGGSCTLNQNTTSITPATIPYQEKLDKFIVKVAAKKLTMSNSEYKAFLEKLISQIGILSVKYFDNEKISSMLDYLETGVKSIQKDFLDGNVDDLLCELGMCDDTLPPTSSSSTSSGGGSINGVCGSSNGNTYSIAPSTNLCTSGSPTAVSGTGPWTWVCAGISGGATVNCSASLVTNQDTTNTWVKVATSDTNNFDTSCNYRVYAKNTAGLVTAFYPSRLSSTSFVYIDGSNLWTLSSSNKTKATYSSSSLSVTNIEKNCTSPNTISLSSSDSFNTDCFYKTSASNISYNVYPRFSSQSYIIYDEGNSKWQIQSASKSSSKNLTTNESTTVTQLSSYCGNRVKVDSNGSFDNTCEYKIVSSDGAFFSTSVNSSNIAYSEGGVIWYVKSSNIASIVNNGNSSTKTALGLYKMCGQSTSTQVNGSCGSANGTTVSTIPSSNLCSIGSASSVSGSGPWSWTCAGSNGGTTASCTAQKTNLTTNGSCGSANGSSVSSAPSSNLCSAGTTSVMTENEAKYFWTCAGSNGGTATTCSAQKTTPVNTANWVDVSTTSTENFDTNCIYRAYGNNSSGIYTSFYAFRLSSSTFVYVDGSSLWTLSSSQKTKAVNGSSSISISKIQKKCNSTESLSLSSTTSFNTNCYYKAGVSSLAYSVYPRFNSSDSIIYDEGQSKWQIMSSSKTSAKNLFNNDINTVTQLSAYCGTWIGATSSNTFDSSCEYKILSSDGTFFATSVNNSYITYSEGGVVWYVNSSNTAKIANNGNSTTKNVHGIYKLCP